MDWPRFELGSPESQSDILPRHITSPYKREKIRDLKNYFPQLVTTNFIGFPFHCKVCSFRTRFP